MLKSYEAYCRDTSAKTRSQLEIKRQRGDFIGSFAVFGYRKDPENHHRLLVDDYAADVVRDMFKWKLEGISVLDIAGRLNGLGIPTPMDYKRSQGMRYSTSFRVKEKSVWDAGMVLRILKNPVYIGVLEQGRVTTPSYKVKRLVHKPREEWAIVENCHEAVIDRYDFESVQKVLTLDTRTSASGKAVELFSGMAYCGECGSAIIRKTVPSGKKKYTYFICAAHKHEKTCFAHSMWVEALDEIVLDALKKYIQDVIDLSNLLEPSFSRPGYGSLAEGRGWMGQFRKHQNIDALDRTIVVTLIERVLIYRERRVEVVYRWQNEFRWQMDLLMQAQAMLPEREVV